jgi:O-antigen/teichoic acid export membrane protein
MTAGGPAPPAGAVERTLARGAALALLGKLAGLLDPLTLLVFAHLYGAPTLGLYFVLWAWAEGLSKATLLAAPKTLQRFVPGADTGVAHAFVRAAFLLPLALGAATAAVAVAAAPWLAAHLTLGGDEVAAAIRLYAWVVPLLAVMRIPLNALRAREVFGPDLRVRTLAEPLAFLVAGVALWALGAGPMGPFAAQVLSLALGGALAVRALSRHYDLRQLVRPQASLAPELRGEALRFAAWTALYDVVHHLQNRVDVMLLGALLTGPGGAASIAAYGAARKLVGALTGIRQSAEYVVGPVASGLFARGAIGELRESYAATTRWVYTLAVPILGLLAALGPELLSLFGPGFAAAATVLVWLAAGRGVDAATGPSSMILAMIGRPGLPLLNTFAATAVSAGLAWLAIPFFGIEGAAAATAAGLVVLNVSAHVEIRLGIGIQPFDARLVRPLLSGALAVAALLAATAAAGAFGALAKLGAALAWLCGFVWLLARVGLAGADRALLAEALAALRARRARDQDAAALSRTSAR